MLLSETCAHPGYVFSLCYYLIVIRCVPNHVLFSPVESRVRVIALLGWIVPIHVPICPQVGRGVSPSHSTHHRPHSYLSISGVPFVSPAGGRRRLGFGTTDSGIPLIRITTTPTTWSVLKMK